MSASFDTPTKATPLLDADFDPTELAKKDSVLTPRFYTTDMKAMDDLDMTPVRSQWDKLMQEFRDDNNRRHFQRDDSFTKAVDALPPELYQEFMDFLISSCTSEFSGCVLYADIKKSVQNPDVRELMGFMARDESRHAGFINKALEDFGHQIELARLTREKKYTFFKPKYIFYATYLSEKIGYARYIRIFRQLEKHPELRFHPIFKWFHDWCNDEFRHGEAFALIIRANPRLTSGLNRLWIRFFLLAVYATMFVRDHSRPEMHKAMGLNAADYGFEVFKITNDISKQVFPFTLDIDAPQFRKGLEKLLRISQENDAAKERGGILGRLTRARCAVSATLTFAGLYLRPTVPNELPEEIRMAPAW